MSGTFAHEIAQHLPVHRPIICDLSCGDGSFLVGAANASTRFLIGCDIHPGQIGSTRILRLTADLPPIYPLLVEINWLADLLVLNPSSDLYWRRDALTFLAESDVPAVAEAFHKTEANLNSDTINSAVATLCIALDRLTYRGEGLLIANNATLDRLVLHHRAPHHALARHIWGRVVMPVNPITGQLEATAVIYFARDHERGVRCDGAIHREQRTGAYIAADWMAYTDTVRLWRAVQKEWQIGCSIKRTDYNLSLRPDGTIHVHLSGFDYKRVGKAPAKQLFGLRGKHPIQLVIQRSSREYLHKQLSLCRTEPALSEAVKQALSQYYAERAPLYPLPATQRLGYLDEHDCIICIRDFVQREVRLFAGDKIYPIRTKTVKVTRLAQRRNLKGEVEHLKLTGQELAILITGENGEEVCFVSDPCRVPQNLNERYLVLDLRTLIEHFQIPEVPDVATVHRTTFDQNLQTLTKLEELISD